MMKSVASWIILISWTTSVFSARILVVLPFPVNSHHIFSTEIIKTLALRGHQIVEYSPLPPNTLIPNHTHIEIHTSFEDEMSGWNFERFIYQTTHLDKSFFGCKYRRNWQMNYKICADTFSHPNIQKLIKSNQHFDLVMSESTFGQESLLALGYRFSAPTVAIETCFPFSILNRYAGNSLDIASVPDLTSSVTENEPMSFIDRLFNFISVSLTLLQHHFIHLPRQDDIVKTFFKDPRVPPVAEMVSNVSLYLTNSYPTIISYVRPYTSNIIPIGGITLSSERTALPQDIESFMNDAKDGVIFFSLGSIVPLHVMPKQIIQIFINVLRKLPQKVIWKISELDSSFELPKNVLIKKWAPQAGVLAHRNCKLFITHGGLMSSHEVIHTGVPIVGIPFFADQPFNVRFLEHRGLVVKVDFNSLTEDTLHKAVTEVLNNPKYQENAERVSRIYRDRPHSAQDSVVFWIEYVLRHKGAHHLRPSSATIPIFQLYLFDIIATILVSVFILILIVYKTVKKLLTVIPRTRDVSNKNKIKKNI